MRKLIRITAIVLGSIFLLCLIAGWFLSTAPGENLMKGWLESQISAELGLPVSIGSLETNLLTRVQLDTLVVMPKGESGKEPTLYVGRLRIQFSIPDLIRDQIRLGLIEVDSVALLFEFDSLGQSGIPFLDEPTPSAEESADPAQLIIIDSVSLSRIGASYRDVQLPLLANASGVRLSAAGDADGSYTGHVNISGCTVVYDSLILAIEDVEAAATMRNDILQLDYARANIEGLNVQVSGSISISGKQELSLTVGIEGSIVRMATAAAAAYSNIPVNSGFVDIDLELKGTLDDPRVSLEGYFHDIVSTGLTIDTGSISGQYGDGEITLTALQLRTMGGTVAAKGSTGLDSAGHTQVAVTLSELALAEIWQAMYSEISPYRGRLSGTINATGEGTDWELWALNAAIRGDGLRYDDKVISDLSCQASLESGRATLLLVHGADTIRSDLRISSDRLEGEFAIKVPELTALARFMDEPDLAGELQANGAISGLFSNPVLSASVFGSRISYSNFPVDTISAQLSYSDSQLTIIKLECKGHLDSINAASPPFDIDSIGGAITYQCQFSGPLDNLQGKLTTSMVSPGYTQYSLDSLTAEVLLSGSRIEVTHLNGSKGDMGVQFSAVFDTASQSGSFHLTGKHVAAADGEENQSSPHWILDRDILGIVEGQFSLESDSRFKASINGDRLWLGLIPKLLNDTLQIRGDASFSLDLAGPYFTPNAALDARIKSLEIADQRVDSLVAGLQLDSKALTLDSLNCYASGQTLRTAGHLDLSVSDDGYYIISPNGRLEADLSTSDFELAAFKEIFLPEGEIAGKVSAALQVSGPTLSPQFNGWLTLSEGSVQLAKDSPPLEAIAVSLSFVDTLLTIDSATSTISNIPVKVNGTLVSSRFESASADIEMRVGQFGKVRLSGSFSGEKVQLAVISDTVNLASLKPFIPVIDSLAGRLNANIIVRGELASPEFYGQMKLTATAFSLTRHNIHITNGYAYVKFDQNQISIDSVSALLNGGSIFLAGLISHDQGELTDVGLEARASNVRLEESGTYILNIDSTALKYGRMSEGYTLEGDILLGESRFTAGLRPSMILPWVQSIETVDMELPDLIARSRLDIRIRESENLWVDNNLARIRMRAEIGVIGTPLRPNFTGLVRIEEGYLIYLDRRFKVNEGTVYFTDPNRFNPDIKLDARTQVTIYRRTASDQYTIYIQAEGYLDQLRYGLFSEPALDKTDIVALLTIGATRSELTKSGNGSGGSGLSQVLKDRAAMLTSQRVSRYVSRKAGAIFGFDEFSIQGNLFQFDDSWGPQLVASKRLSQKIDLTYSTTVGHLNDQSVRLGYRFTNRWSLMGETDRQGRSGLDLKYGIRFR